MASIFDQAKSCISRSLIEALFPGGTWKGDDYWPTSPLRSDSKPGSFHISVDGLWKDFATGEGGDLVSLVSKARGVSLKEAAAEIIRRSGGTPEEAPRRTSAKKKIPAVIPIPDDARAALNAEISSASASERHGEKAVGWRYYTADGGWAFAVVRYNKPDGGKDVIPYYYGDDGRWHEGQAYADKRPLYNLPAIVNAPADARFLIVEGEKCGSVSVPGWILTTWSAGALSTAKTDFSPITQAAAEGRVTIWPDADEPGLKAAQAIARRLPGARVLDIQGKPAGWDIADAQAEGADLSAFLRDCPTTDALAPDAPADAETAQFFRCLGYDAERYWFLLEGKRITRTIGAGSFNSSKIQELAPLNFWSVLGMVGDQGGVKVAVAQDYLQKIQGGVGRYDPDRLRGAGVWRDGDEIIVNDGRQIMTRDGRRIAFADYASDYFYLTSDATFGDLSGEASTDEEGRDLLELFKTQGWVKEVHALAALGWALIAPFGGILAWRPHIWISGRKGTGKSWLLEHLVDQLLGDFGYLGTGKTTEAAMRRSLKVDARPVRLDEMEAKTGRMVEKINSILDLERNSSSDASGYMEICAIDGGVAHYRIRSCFCNASVSLPAMDAAVESRIIGAELRWHTPEAMRKKKERSAALLARCMGDPGRFRRRMFRELPNILENIEFLRNEGLDGIGDQRQADQWAPIIAAVFAIVYGGKIESARGAELISPQLEAMGAAHSEIIEDEDRVIEHILGYAIEDDHKKRRTVAEWLAKADDYADEGKLDAADLLGRYGLRLCKHNGQAALAIAVNADAIKKMLGDTPYAAGYGAQIRRHPLCVTPDAAESIRMSGQGRRSRLLAWQPFKEMYMRKDEEGVE